MMIMTKIMMKMMKKQLTRIMFIKLTGQILLKLNVICVNMFNYHYIIAPNVKSNLGSIFVINAKYGWIMKLIKYFIAINVVCAEVEVVKLAFTVTNVILV